MDFPTLLVHVAITLAGLALHFAMKWAEYRRVVPLGFLPYLKQVPAQTTVACCATVASFLVIASLDWLNPGTAFSCGYMGHSVAENLANRYSALK